MESTEHWHVGDSIVLRDAEGNPHPAADRELHLHSGSFTYGQLVALGGDFYGTPDLTPISTSPNPRAAFSAAFNTLNAASPEEVKEIGEIMIEERSAVDAKRAAGQSPSLAFKELGNQLSYKWNEITGGGPASRGDMSLVLQPGRYMRLAKVNMDHFGAQALTAYTAGHAFALEVAAHARALHDSEEAASTLDLAYAHNAFADHFLTDLFAAGHVRTPRYPLYQMTMSPREESGFLAKCMHDEDNHQGLTVSNALGDTWRAYGDGMELDPVNADNLAMAIRATQVSADEVHRAFATGIAEAPTLGALQLIPSEVAPPVHTPRAADGPNYAPLFWADPKGYVYRRGGKWPSGWRDQNSFSYTYYWSSKTMCLEIRSDFDIRRATGGFR